MATVKGKIISAGYDWSIRVQFTDVATDFPLGATFRAHVRANVDSKAVLADLTTANGCITRVDNKTIDIKIPGDISKTWSVKSAEKPAGLTSVVFDVVRTDLTPDVYLGFQVTIPVARPITRGIE